MSYDGKKAIGRVAANIEQPSVPPNVSNSGTGWSNLVLPITNPPTLDAPALSSHTPTNLSPTIDISGAWS
jgi:hypothetical protein